MIHNFPSFSARALAFSWLALRDAGVTEQAYIVVLDNGKEFEISIKELPRSMEKRIGELGAKISAEMDAK